MKKTLDRFAKVWYSSFIKMGMVAALLLTVSVTQAASLHRPSPELLSAMAHVETRHNPEAYNSREHAVGLFQVRQLAVDDINRKFRTSYTLADFYREPMLGAWAVWAYGSIYNAKTDFEFAVLWNGGPRGRQKKDALLYWQKVKERMSRAAR